MKIKNIKNYTSEMPMEKSMALIEKNLVSAGASKIMKNYNPDGECRDISFQIEVNKKAVSFMLPVRTDAIYDALIGSYVKPTERSYEICKEQAIRTAWKLISDWVAIQISMIQLDQADLMQVFLPYVHDGKTSLYQKLMDSEFKLLNG